MDTFDVGRVLTVSIVAWILEAFRGLSPGEFA